MNIKKTLLYNTLIEFLDKQWRYFFVTNIFLPNFSWSDIFMDTYIYISIGTVYLISMFIYEISCDKLIFEKLKSIEVYKVYHIFVLLFCLPYLSVFFSIKFLSMILYNVMILPLSKIFNIIIYNVLVLPLLKFFNIKIYDKQSRR